MDKMMHLIGEANDPPKPFRTESYRGFLIDYRKERRYTWTALSLHVCMTGTARTLKGAQRNAYFRIDKHCLRNPEPVLP